MPDKNTLSLLGVSADCAELANLTAEFSLLGWDQGKSSHHLLMTAALFNVY